MLFKLITFHGLMDFFMMAQLGNLMLIEVWKLWFCESGILKRIIYFPNYQYLYTKSIANQYVSSCRYLVFLVTF